MTDWRNDELEDFLSDQGCSGPQTQRAIAITAGQPPTTPANKPYDKAFENAFRRSHMRIGMRYIGD